VEGDLGMRWNARGVVQAGRLEHLLTGGGMADGVDAELLSALAAMLEADPTYLPKDNVEVGLDLALARVAAVAAVRRHARPPSLAAGPSLARLAYVIGSGGVLRHSPKAMQEEVLRAVTAMSRWLEGADKARTTVDSAYLLFAAACWPARKVTGRRWAPRWLLAFLFD